MEFDQSKDPERLIRPESVLSKESIEMIAEAFLICALAVPSTTYRMNINHENIKRINEVHDLHEYLKQHYPGSETWIGPKPPEEGYERVPFLWKNKKVWIKRPTISDRKMKVCA